MNERTIAILLVACFAYGNALECYVCTKQATNDVKCLKSIATCEQNEDVCLTEVRWGSTPYWTAGGQKQYFVSKRCSTKKECNRIKRASMPYCTLLWYQDWKCTDCCVGDRCNSYIFSGSQERTVTPLTLLLAGIGSCLGTSFFLRN